MSWLIPSVILSLTSVLILAMLFTYLYTQDREGFLAIWAGSWGVYIVRLVSEIWMASGSTQVWLLLVRQVAILASTLLLVWGTYVFLGRRMPAGWLAAVLAVLLWSVPAALSSQPANFLNTPAFLFQSASYVWIGVQILRFKKIGGLGKFVTGWAFILWGIHKIDYPVVSQLPWLLPWGYSLASVLELAVAIGMLVIYFEKGKEELRQREARLKAIFDNAVVGIAVSDTEGKFIQVNQRLADMLGYTTAELLQMQQRDVNRPEDLPAITHQLQALYRGEVESYQVDRQLICKDGRLLWVSLSVSPIHDRSGEIEAVTGLLIDISQRKKAEDSLQRTTYQQERLIETARHLTESLEVKQVLHQIARGAFDILESTSSALYLLSEDGRKLDPVVVIDPKYHDQVLATPLEVEHSMTGQVVLARSGVVFNDIHASKHAFQIPGTPVEDEERVMAAPFIVDGQVVGAMCVSRMGTSFSAEDLALAETFATYASTALKNARAHDRLQREVEERKQADLALRESEARYRSLFEDSPISLWEEDFSALKAELDRLQQNGAKDLDAYLEGRPEEVFRLVSLAKIVDVNRATVAIYQVSSKAELLGELSRILEKNSFQEQKTFLLTVAGGQTRFDGEITNRRGLDEVFPVALRWTVAPGCEHSYAKVLVSSIDISERKRAEKELRESEERFRMILQQSVEAICQYDAQSKCLLEANPAFLDLLGYTPGEIGGLTLYDVVAHPQENIDAIHKQLSTSRGLVIGDRLWRRKDGGLVNVEVSVNMIRQDGRELVFVMGRDIRDRVQREREREVILALATALRAARTRADILCITAQQAMRLLHADGVSLGLRDLLSGDTVIELAIGDAACLLGKHFEKGKSVSGYVIETGLPYLNNDLRTNLRNLSAEAPYVPPCLASVPLITDDGPIGAISAGREQQISESEVRLLLAMGEIAANAIQRETLHEQTQQHASSMARVSAIGRSLAEKLDLPDVYNCLSTGVQELLLDVSTIFISRFDPERKVIRAVYGIENGKLMDVRPLPELELAPPGKGTQSEVIHTRRPLIINNHLADKMHTKVEVGEENGITQSAIFVPLLARGQILGVLQVQSYIPDRFSQAEAELLAITGNTAAIAMQNAELFDETERRLQHLDALHNIDKAITTNFNLDITLNVVLEQVTSQLGVHAACVLLYDAPAQSLIYTNGCGFRSQPVRRASMRLAQGSAGQVVLEQRMVSIADLTPAAPGLLPGIFNLKSEEFKAYFGMPLITKGQVKGVLELYHRAPLEPDQEWLTFLDTLANRAAIAIDNASLFDDLQRSNFELTLAFDTTLEGWAKALELRDKETEGHSQRVIDLTVKLARRLGMGGEELVHLRRGSLLHDIGKMGIPDSILLKPGPLMEDEWEIMRQHPVLAYNLLAPIPFLHKALEIPYAHHEKWDGSGYPRRLVGEQIPLAARVFAVVDVWDALTNDRPYRPAWSEQRTLEYIVEQRGKHFDPQVVEAFLRLREDEGRRMMGGD